MIDVKQIDVIAPNFKKRMSGVTSTVIRLVPLQARDIAIAATGPKLPKDVPQFAPLRLLTMGRRGPNGYRVWHARRNSEMLPGIVLKYLLGKRLKLVFTSAAQRRHSTYTRWLIRCMDAVIATSAQSAAYLEVPHTVIHHGIDTEAFSPSTNKAVVRQKLGLPEDATLVGCFGRIRPQKGNDLFVDAMLRLLPRHKNAVAVMMGGVTDQFQDFAHELAQKVKSAGLEDRFLILREAPDWEITQYFQALDLYVAPQRWEGFGLTPLEAMACAVPVVATRVGAFEELIADQETGHLINIEDVDAMVSATDTLLSSVEVREKYARAARARAVGHFGIEGEAQAIIDVYTDLLGTS